MGENQYQASTQNNNGFLDIQLAKSEAAMTEQNFEDVITLSTGSLDKLMETYILRLLELRATAFEKKGLLSRASEDATRMIQYVPTSPAGYLKTGHILMTHGKPSLAADSYKKGLHSIPESHHQYKQLQKEYAKATARAQERFDIVGKLPRELVYKVLINLDPERIWICLKVSKRWCDQIVGYGTWWSTVVVKQMGTEIDQTVCDAILLVKDYIQKLELTDLSSADLNRKYLMYFKYGTFKDLKELTLKGAFFKDVVSEDFAIALWQLRGTLTSLNVDFESGKAFPLSMVLGSCPDITELCYTTSGDISVWNGGTGYGSECKKLSSLELRYAHTTYSILCSHLTACPNLRRLILKSSSTQALGDPASNGLANYCPKLKILGLNSTEELPDVDDCESLATKNGVTHLSVEYCDHFTNFAKKFVSTQSHSLRWLNIIQRRCCIQRYNYTTGYIITSETYSKLSTLQYMLNNGGYSHPFNCSDCMQQVVAMIIERSPHLTDLSLSGTTSFSQCIRTSLEQAVKVKIRSLTLISVSFGNTNTTWYDSFFSSLTSVHVLVLQGIDLSNGKLPSLAASESIRQLTINKCTGITNEILDEFFKRVAIRPTHQLNTFDINSIPISMDNSTIRFLVRTHGLKTLTITNCKGIDVDSINYLIACAPTSSLKTIEILNCFPTHVAVSWSDSVDSLEKKGVALSIE